jgi:hypothetical protein
MLGLRGEDEMVYETYNYNISTSHVIIKDTYDELIWSKNPERGIYNPKVGDRVLCDWNGLCDSIW